MVKKMWIATPYIFLAGVIPLAFSDIPSYIKVCHSTENNISKCITDSVNQLRSKLKAGIPELDVPSIEPLPLSEIKLRNGPNSAKLDANITNLKVWGPSTYQVIDLRANIKKAKFAFKFKIPFLHFEGDYQVDMKLLILQYKGSGPLNGNFTDTSFSCIMKGNKILENGEEYLKFERMNLKLEIGKESKIRFENLFVNDPLFASATTSLINQNTNLLIDEIRPALEKSLADKFTEIANKITLKFTYKQLFP